MHHYFVSYTVQIRAPSLSAKFQLKQESRQVVIDIHPFRWQAEPSRHMERNLVGRPVIVSWKKLSEEDYDAYTQKHETIGRPF